jgi:hypothetical protein
MSSEYNPSSLPKLDISKWRNVPWIMIGVGAVVALIGIAMSHDPLRQFGFSWLLAFMFCLSFALGGWFLVMIHHLTDASWSVPIRRIEEALACLLSPAMLIAFLPLAFLAPKIYPWLQPAEQMHPDHAVHSKYPLFTVPGYYVAAAIMFAMVLFQSPSLLVAPTGQNGCGYLHL